MQIYNYFLFFCFINLCNSFTFINKKYGSTFISRNFSYKLNMGCDYYIDKDLQIYDYNDIMISDINLEHNKGYYWLILDEDEDGYNTEMQSYISQALISQALEPVMEPITIYSNNTFHKLSFENKYKKIIEDDLHFNNKTWNDVNKIIKIENRYER